MATDQVVTVRGEALITKLRWHRGKVAVDTVREAFECCTIAAILAIFEIVTLVNVAAIVEIISIHVLTIESVVVLHNFLPRQHLHPLASKLHRAMTAGIQFGEFLQVILA